MTTENTYRAKCTCGAVETSMSGSPKVRGTCHCEDCRVLLNTPYHSVNAWEKEFVEVLNGSENLVEYKHPNLNMKKFSCKTCGDVVFNSNGMDWRVFSQFFISKSYDGKLPEELSSKMHFFYGRRVVNVDDDLPKKD